MVYSKDLLIFYAFSGLLEMVGDLYFYITAVYRCVSAEYIERKAVCVACSIRDGAKRITAEDAFIGYHQDTAASLVIQTCKAVQVDETNIMADAEKVLVMCENEMKSLL